MPKKLFTLEAVADISIARGPAEIRRVSQERVAIISANLAYGDRGAPPAIPPNAALIFEIDLLSISK